jgi:exopolysaccharide biosynthesis polyprenyl glycosylphosphotransferase
MPMKYPKYKYFFAIADLIVILASLVLSYCGFFRHMSLGDYLAQALPSGPIFVLIACFFVFVFHSNNLYKSHIILQKSAHVIGIIKSYFYALVVLIVASFLMTPPTGLGRLLVLNFSWFSLLSLVVVRVYLLRWLYLQFVNASVFRRRIVIAGGGKAGQILAEKIHFEDDYGLEIAGFLDDNIPVGETVLFDYKVLGKIDDLPRILQQVKLDEMVVAIDNISYERLLDIIDQSQNLGIHVKVTSELLDIIPQKLVVEKYSGIPIVNSTPKVNPEAHSFYKRIFDLVGSALGIMLLSPLFLAIAIIIKRTSKGPVIYRQIRVGKNGRPFTFYKFRSMTVKDEEDVERVKMMLEFMKNDQRQSTSDTKIINPARVTSVGRFIRRTSFDELPQLFNVLKGDMSLVGPRPCLPYEYENFDDWQKRRMAVLPGCTGLWQVSGRSAVSFKDSVVLDIYYIQNMSPWFDLQLILKTVLVMLFTKGGK